MKVEIKIGEYSWSFFTSGDWGNEFNLTHDVIEMLSPYLLKYKPIDRSNNE